MVERNLTPPGRDFYDRPVLDVARDLLGCVLRHEEVAVRLTEVEAYDGDSDPASHAWRGQTPRNDVMYGEPGHAYVYFTYGMHFCVNLVCGPAGKAAAVLLRAGDIVEGSPVALGRRPGASARDLARGPARLCKALAIERRENGADVTSPSGTLVLFAGDSVPEEQVRRGPRVGVSRAADLPWRLWIDGERSVSPYRPWVARKRSASSKAGSSGAL